MPLQNPSQKNSKPQIARPQAPVIKEPEGGAAKQRKDGLVTGSWWLSLARIRSAKSKSEDLNARTSTH